MSARYLIRLDDACHTMHPTRWSMVEDVLDAHRVRPIVAVIPDNNDSKLTFAPSDPGFWARVRSWEAKGWAVGMHGHTHVMHSVTQPPVLPYYRRSEFAGLPLEAQAAKIRCSWQLFAANGVRPQVWIAPAHSFDLTTLQALRRETPIRVISDGVAWDSYFEHDFNWIPQQLWALAERPSGLWTVCLHPNTMETDSISALDAALGRFHGRLTCLDDVPLRQRRKSVIGHLYHAYFWWRWRTRAHGV
jgi:hypothetical protein